MRSTLHTLKSLLFPPDKKIEGSLFVYVLFPLLFIFTEESSWLWIFLYLLFAFYFCHLSAAVHELYTHKGTSDTSKALLKKIVDDIYVDAYICISVGVGLMLSFFTKENLIKQSLGLIIALIGLYFFRKAMLVRKQTGV